MSIRAHIIIVTHNSVRDYSNVVALLRQQQGITVRITVVDSGSSSVEYIHSNSPDELILMPNIGFAKANNIAAKLTLQSEYLVLVNPDLYIFDPTLLQTICNRISAHELAYGTVMLHGYDPKTSSPTGLIDSAGLEFDKFGFARDRDQGKSVTTNCRSFAPIFGACGAFSVYSPCTVEYMQRVFGCLFWEALWSYKEDVELSLRLKRHRVKFEYFDDLIAFHCRGWKPGLRNSVPYRLRCISSRNDFLIDIRHRLWHTPFSILKLLLAIAGI